jgi:hypothetical protein
MIRDPWMVRCPVCGADVGWPCRDVATGAILTSSHRRRHDAAGGEPGYGVTPAGGRPHVGRDQAEGRRRWSCPVSE